MSIKVTKEQLQALIQAQGAQGLANMMGGAEPDYITSLSGSGKARLEAVKKVQEKHDEIEMAYEKELRALEEKYQALYKPLYDERRDYIIGAKDVAEAKAEDPKGIPEFWLRAMQNLPELHESITEKDEEVLKYLTDVRSEFLPEEKTEDGEILSGFRLTFIFAENEHFSNTTLTKDYIMTDDNMLIKIKSTKIEWKEGKNITVKLVKKKTRKGKVTREEKTESFFNFFQSLEIPEDEDEEQDEEGADFAAAQMIQADMEEDYGQAEAIRENLIPNAVGFYTGEAVDDEMMYGDDDEDDEDDDDEEDEDEEEEEEKPKKKGGKAAGGGAEIKTAGDQPPECKNQ